MILFLRQRPWSQYKKIKTIVCFSWIIYDISERYILKKRNRWKKEESLKDLFWSCDLIASIRKDLMSRILFWHCPFLYPEKKFYNSLNIRERTVKYLYLSKLKNKNISCRCHHFCKDPLSMILITFLENSTVPFSIYLSVSYVMVVNEEL